MAKERMKIVWQKVQRDKLGLTTIQWRATEALCFIKLSPLKAVCTVVTSGSDRFPFVV